MCQMIIHATARDTTMLQAVAHNLHTSASDLETLVRVLDGRGQIDEVTQADLVDAVTMLGEIEQTLLAIFTERVAAHPHTAGDHSACDAHPHGVELADAPTTAQSV